LRPTPVLLLDLLRRALLHEQRDERVSEQRAVDGVAYALVLCKAPVQLPVALAPVPFAELRDKQGPQRRPRPALALRRRGELLQPTAGVFGPICGAGTGTSARIAPV
jgi:hypothetical protein